VIARSAIGWRTPAFAVEVEKGRVRQFARAIGETDPVYLDEQAARAAGYASLPVPPTFLFCLEMERDDPYDWFAILGIPLAKVLHGEQRFVYRRVACAGEILRFSGEIVDRYEKKNGALEFVVQRNWIADAWGGAVAEFDRTLVIRHD
jgi:hypothetical protein